MDQDSKKQGLKNKPSSKPSLAQKKSLNKDLTGL